MCRGKLTEQNFVRKINLSLLSIVKTSCDIIKVESNFEVKSRSKTSISSPSGSKQPYVESHYIVKNTDSRKLFSTIMKARQNVAKFAVTEHFGGSI